MSGAKILWVDDEIDLLETPILFLKGKDYDVETATTVTMRSTWWLRGSSTW